MPALTLDLFAASTDAEASRYRILAGLRTVRGAFAHSEIYPHLADLIALRSDLAAFIDGVEAHRASAPGRVIGVDWDRGTLVTDGESAPPILAHELAMWALPEIDALIAEGSTLYEFVDAHAQLSVVGLVPAYRSEGVLVVHDETDETIALRYAVSQLTGADGAYRSLRTHRLAVDLPRLGAPSAWTKAVREACPDLPTPAVYRLDTDLAFPLDATLLPVAKRKLLRAAA